MNVRLISTLFFLQALPVFGAVQSEASGGRADIGGAEQSVRTLATVQTADELSQIQLSLGDGREDVGRQGLASTKRQRRAEENIPALSFFTQSLAF